MICNIHEMNIRTLHIYVYIHFSYYNIMYPFAKFVVQPLPYSKSLLYPLLIKNSAFLQWYQTHRNFDETYRVTQSSPQLSYSYSYRYETQPVLRDLHIYPGIDTITCSLLVSHDKRVYNESIFHKVHYLQDIERKYGKYTQLDYIIKTEHNIQLDGNIIRYDAIDKDFLTKLHL